MSKVQGIQRVQSNFKKLADEIAGKRAERAVYAVTTTAGNFAALKTPIATSNLINSHFVEIKSEPGAVTGRNGYTASYAAAVHNAPGTNVGQNTPRENNLGYMWDPDAEPGFLAKGLEEVKPMVPSILKKVFRNGAG